MLSLPPPYIQMLGVRLLKQRLAPGDLDRSLSEILCLFDTNAAKLLHLNCTTLLFLANTIKECEFGCAGASYRSFVTVGRPAMRDCRPVPQLV